MRDLRIRLTRRFLTLLLRRFAADLMFGILLFSYHDGGTKNDHLLKIMKYNMISLPEIATGLR